MNKAVVFLFVVGLMISVAKAWWSVEYDSKDKTSPLRFPEDCNSDALRNFATNCGLQDHSMGDHFVLSDPKSNRINSIVMVIPEKMRDFGKCEKIVRDLNARCAEDYYNY